MHKALAPLMIVLVLPALAWGQRSTASLSGNCFRREWRSHSGSARFSHFRIDRDRNPRRHQQRWILHPRRIIARHLPPTSGKGRISILYR